MFCSSTQPPKCHVSQLVHLPKKVKINHNTPVITRVFVYAFVLMYQYLIQTFTGFTV